MISYKKYYTIAICLSTLSMIVDAEVVLDGTLGPSGALSGPDFAIDASLGQQVGPNLFHSFESFNIHLGESATFTGPAAVAHIISRVTGGQPSSINGQLSSKIPGADMYFLNPAGIMFGQNASLDVQGSLYISTADYLKLGEDSYFDATTPSNSLLTVAPPSAFGFLDAPTGITIESSQLDFPNSETIQQIRTSGNDIPTAATFSLVSGDISFKYSLLITGGNDVHLVSVASTGEAPLELGKWTDDTFAIYGTLSMSNDSEVDASGFGGGEVFIRAGQMVLDSGLIFADTWGNKAGRGITIHANGAFIMKNDSWMTTDSLNYFDPNEDLPSWGFSEKLTGNGGHITISANEITLTNGSQIQSTSKTAGNAGDITLSAQNRFSLTGANSTGQFSGVFGNTHLSGKGGKMEILAKDLVMEEGATIQGETRGIGDAGDISIKVDTVSLLGGSQIHVGAGLSVGVAEEFSLYPDDYPIKTLLWQWQDGTGKAGKLMVKAKGTVQISGSKTGFFSNVLLAKGEGGTIDITTPILIVTEQGSIEAGSQRWGDGGNILLNVDTLNVSNNGFITAETLGEGAGGHIDIRANHVHLADGGTITANSKVEGLAGDIQLTLGDKLTMNQGFIETEAKSADGGNIAIIAQNYLYLVDSGISTSVGTGLGGGGNITLRPEFVIQKGSPIIAEAYGGPGGNINITTTGIYKSPPDSLNNRISASSQFGVDGVVEINRPGNDVMEDIVIQTSEFLDARGLLNTPCNQRTAGLPSRFVMVHSYGESNALNDLLPSGLISLEPIEVKTPVAGKSEGKKRLPPLMARLIECQPLRLSMSAHSARVKTPK